MDRPKIFKSKKEIPQTAKIIDVFPGALKELFFVAYPQFKLEKSGFEQHLEKFLDSHQNDDVWIYYPWNNTAVRCLNEDLYFRLRTARNHDVITEQEQMHYRDIVLGVAGLSVGSAIISSLVMTGGPKTLRIADFDTVAVSNLNRIRAALTDVGSNKALVVARSVWEVDPFSDINIWQSGINRNTLDEFIKGKKALDIFVDAMDDIEMKINARKLCKKYEIPVLMATDNGDGVIVDVERFDLEPTRSLSPGFTVDTASLKKTRSREWLKAALQIIGPRYMTRRHQESILRIGKSLAGPPQLGTAAYLAGAAISYVVRRIANKQSMPSGRYVFGLEEKFILSYSGSVQRKRRMAETKKFVKEFATTLKPKIAH